MMSYYITTKVTYDSGKLIGSPIAFPLSSENLATFSTWVDWNDWTESNYDALVNGSISVEDFFSSNPNCYEGFIYTETIEGMNLTLIEEL